MSEELGRGVALYDCTPPRADVLGFKKGEIIVLLSQSSEDWYVGEIDGRTGLVAKNYIRVLPNELVRQDTLKSPRSGSVSSSVNPAAALAANNKSPRPAAPAASPAQVAAAAPGAGAAPPSLVRVVSSSGGLVAAKQPPRPVSSIASQPAMIVTPVPAKTAIPVAAPAALAPPAAAPSSPGKPYTAIADYVGARDNVLSFAKGDVIMILDQSRQDWWRGVLRGRTGAVPATYVRPVDAVTAAGGATLQVAAKVRRVSKLSFVACLIGF